MRSFGKGLLVLSCGVLLGAWPGVAIAAGRGAALPRERAAEQIPELMGRILESQEEIQASQKRLAPVVERFEGKLTDSRRRIDKATSESEAAKALVDYVEAYDQRLEAQSEGLHAIEGPIARMVADARQLVRAANSAGSGANGTTPAAQQAFLQDHFQGIAEGISTLARELGREADASVAGAVLEAGWAAEHAPKLPLSKLGPEAAVTFARRTEGLYARYQARARQLAGERRAVRQLLDMLIERQLAERMDTLFAAGGECLLGQLVAGDAGSDDWQALGDVVNRALGLPTAVASTEATSDPSLDRLDYFAAGRHRN